MTRSSRILATLLTVGCASSALAEPARQGDAERGRAVYRLHCASCHGSERLGDGPLAPRLSQPRPTNLADPAFLMQRPDSELYQAISEGGSAVGSSATMPAFGPRMAQLDAWDVIAFLRSGQLSVSDFFPDAARFTAKEYSYDSDGLKRLDPVIGKLSAEESRIVVTIVFGGKKDGEDPVFVPQDPRLLGSLKPKKKLGYVAFLAVPFPGRPQPLRLALALDRDAKIVALRPELTAADAKDRERIDRLLGGFIGQGGKQTPYAELKPGKVQPKESKPAAELAKALTRAYFRTVEGAVMFDKEERERHWAD